MAIRTSIIAMLLVGLSSCYSITDTRGENGLTRLHQGLVWQVDPPIGSFTWPEADGYCRELMLDELSDWRLPDISELRSLIVGCPGRESGGACRVSDPDCANQDCWNKDDCGHCPQEEGPARGCYWQPDGWGGSCTENWFYWSSTQFDRFSDHFWVVRFQGGGQFDDGVVGFNEELGDGSIRCVHTRRLVGHIEG